MKTLLPFYFLLTMSVTAQKPTEFNSSLDSLFNFYFKPGEPGGAVLLVKDNKVVYKKGFGIADIDSKEAITTQTLFNLGSISKTFVAYGILRLEQEGKLSTNDLLTNYFQFNHPAVVKNIRIYHLLTHTSGLPDSRKVKEQHEFYLTAKDEENWAPILETDSLEFTPGSNYKYSNPAFNALALIIEKISGKKWQDYIRDIIFIPSGMETSTITDGPHPRTGVAHGYIMNEKKSFEELDYGEEPTFAAAGNGGVWSSVEELWKYEQAIQKNIFLDKKTIDNSRSVQQFKKSWGQGSPPIVGLSWFMTKEAGTDMIGHTGSQGGFISDYCWLPDKKVFYILLCNIPKPIKEIRTKLFGLLLKND
jgi:CubicO group peptidase (beta-lactamase class C family)